MYFKYCDIIQVQNKALQIHLDNQNYVCGTYEMVICILNIWMSAYWQCCRLYT